MMIPSGFDESNRERKERINRNALNTAEKLNRRMTMFLNDIYKNESLSTDQKLVIREKLAENL